MASWKSKLNVLGLVLFLSTLRASIFWPLYVNTTTIFSVAWVEIGAWILLAALIVRILRKDGVWGDFVAQWRKEKFLLAFLSFALFSMFWSISFGASLYRTSILLFSTFAGAYIGYQYGAQRLLEVLFWFGAIVIILSFGFSLFVPELSVMSGRPYYGSWRGIYWHRNHLGAITALFNAVFLIRMLAELRVRSKMLILDALFYVLSLLLVYFARSAAGYILAMVLHFSVFAALVWLRFAPRLKPVHYYAIFGIAIVGGVFIFSNLGFILEIFNREPNLTGRIPMWGILINNVVLRSPWIGYGFGAIWTIESFRVGMQHAVGWSFPVLIGDNGFMDILMHVGLIGLALFLGVWVLAWVRSIRNAFDRRKLQDFFPLVFMVFTLVANISFSLFLETESFVWLTMVAILFGLAKGQPKNE